ncbi:MAG: hypothetical protein JW993_02930 [Sedimentisphaerales bacterium]|nr:hypothetical protein [Sedimentisphaerales bacterium]
MTKSKMVSYVVIAFVGMSTVAWAEGDVTVGVDVLSKYVWRGQNVVDDWVLQPSVSVAYKGLTGSIWGNLDLTGDFVDGGEFNEIDYTLDYSAAVPGVEKLGYSVGAIYYVFPNTGFNSTTEVYAGLGLDLPASPAVTVYYDVDEADGMYVSLSAGHSIEKLGDSPVGLDLGASLGWGNKTYNTFYWGTTSSELNDLVLSAGFPFEVAGITVTPKISLITLLGSDIKDADTYDTSNSLVVFGVGFAKEF